MGTQDIRQLMSQWSQLEAAGIPLESLEHRVGIGPRNSGSDVTVRLGRPHWRSEVRELKNGCFGFILPIFIRRNHPGKTIILDVWIGTSSPDTTVELLEDPAFEEKHPAFYNLPGDSERFFRYEVLNHRIINTTLCRGNIRTGILLAVGSRPPDHFKNHDEIPITFTLVDQWDVEHETTLQARMNRRPARATAVARSTRDPLLSRRDVIVPSRSYVAPCESSTDHRENEAGDYRVRLEETARFRSKK
jgi:hypothetical protein